MNRVPAQKWVPGFFRGAMGARQARNANLTAICQRIVQKMWEPRRLTPLWAPTSLHKESFTLHHAIYLTALSHRLNTVEWLNGTE
jgi:hypothetical protein